MCLPDQSLIKQDCIATLIPKIIPEMMTKDRDNSAQSIDMNLFCCWQRKPLSPLLCLMFISDKVSVWRATEGHTHLWFNKKLLFSECFMNHLMWSDSHTPIMLFHVELDLCSNLEIINTRTYVQIYEPDSCK